MKPNFIVSLLSGKDGGISSKRSVMVFLLLLFAFCVLWNLFTGKAPNALYQDQVFEAFLITLAAVLGDKALDVIPTIRGKKTTSSTTIISPEPPTVTTVTNQSEPKQQP